MISASRLTSINRAIHPAASILDDWQATAEATLDAAEALRATLGGRAHLIRQHRGDPPTALSDLVVPPKP